MGKIHAFCSLTCHRDILRLTALFEARRGRSFLAALSQREGRNFQFDFLRPQHSLYGYYNRTVAQYVKIFNPLQEQKDRLEEDKWATLDHARERAAWEKQRRTKQEKQQKEKDEEASEFVCFVQAIVLTKSQSRSPRLTGKTLSSSRRSSSLLLMLNLRSVHPCRSSRCSQCRWPRRGWRR